MGIGKGKERICLEWGCCLFAIRMYLKREPENVPRETLIEQVNGMFLKWRHFGSEIRPRTYAGPFF